MDKMRITTEKGLLEYLDTHGILYTRTEHPPVFTCAEAAGWRSGIQGMESKNLFLRTSVRHTEARAGVARQFFLVMTACEKRLDLKALTQVLGAGKLQFASEAQLMEALGITPGAVTVLALVNDADHRISLLVDADYWPSAAYQSHPLVNTATLVMEHSQLVRFFELTGHTPQVIRMPGRD